MQYLQIILFLVTGRFPFLITVATIFISGTMQGIGASIVSTIAVIFVILLGIFLTLFISKLLSKTILKGMPSSFTLELPPYRRPQIGKILVRSIFDRTLFVLGRAIMVAAPAGLVIWLFATINIDGNSLLFIIANFLEPFAKLRGLDDTFKIGEILLNNGWTMLTAINVMIFTCLHFPCTTTLLTIKKETGSLKWTAISFLLPTVCGILVCICTNLAYNIFI